MLQLRPPAKLQAKLPSFLRSCKHKPTPQRLLLKTNPIERGTPRAQHELFQVEDVPLPRRAPGPSFSRCSAS